MRKKKELFIPAVTIKPGAQGLSVYNLQICLDHILKEKGKRKLIDHEPGHFGPMTEKRVREFQSKYGLFVNGVYSPCTRLRIKEVLNADRNI